MAFVQDLASVTFSPNCKSMMEGKKKKRVKFDSDIVFVALLTIYYVLGECKDLDYEKRQFNF